MPSPVCAKCHVEMRCAKNDFIVEEMADTEFPYRVWFADLWRCPTCAAEVVTGFAPKPWGEHFQPDYSAKAVQTDLRYWPRAEMVPAEASKPSRACNRLECQLIGFHTPECNATPEAAGSAGR